MSLQDSNMMVKQKDGVVTLHFPMLEEVEGISHAFSTRLGGVSQGIFSSMNLSFGRGDSDENVRENYRRICAANGFDPEGLVASDQDHHTNIRIVTAEDKGKGIWRPKDYQSVDAVVTQEPGITLVTYYADCVPLFFVDPVKRVVALAHAGWRGTVGRIGEVTVRKMEEAFGCRPQDLLAAVGPSIGPCCYEVDEPVYQQFAALNLKDGARWMPESGGGKYKLDLWNINRQILSDAGVMPEHIQMAELCTCCNPDQLFSHRASHGQRGGMAAFLQIRPSERV
ncbi:Laccase domain protein YfiH [Eubacteriaceae bacterium CHKCI005]|nr:Laccase domain protein YfiH [Eubacteriaceae bacterium CHKCI005]